MRDFAWATSGSYLWDATCALVGASQPGADTVDIHTFYRRTPQAGMGKRRMDNRKAIEFLSGYLWPYPYPQMMAVEGILTGGGMEYPMLTVFQSYGATDSLQLAANLMHENGHMWFPMQVGSNETRDAWQDEGLTQFNSAQGTWAAYHVDREGPALEVYLGLARSGREVEITRWANLFPSDDLYFPATYRKTTTVLVALRAILEEELFLRSVRHLQRGERTESFLVLAHLVL